MRIAVASEGLGVSPHAVHCASFMCYTIKNGIIAECQNLPNPGLPAEGTVKLLQDLTIDALITGGIDMDFANMLCHTGIEVVAGVEGTAREVTEAYLSHTLIGATELCRTSNMLEQALEDDNDYIEEDREMDETFGRIERELEAASK